MLTLNEAQWQALETTEVRQFVQSVCDDFLAVRTAGQHCGREAILIRMQTAYDYATKLLFTSTPHIVRLMWLAADAPNIHDHPLVDAYLRKPGATPEQRLDDLYAVINSKLKGES